MNKLLDKNCTKCGEVTSLRFVSSSGMDITPTGMFADCGRCGFSESVRSLDEKDRQLADKGEK